MRFPLLIAFDFTHLVAEHSQITDAGVCQGSRCYRKRTETTVLPEASMIGWSFVTTVLHEASKIGWSFVKRKGSTSLRFRLSLASLEPASVEGPGP